MRDPAFAKPPCPACGRDLVRHNGESTDNWRKRKTCGGDCAAEVRRRVIEARRTGAIWPPDAGDGPPTQWGLYGPCFAPYEVRFRPSPGRVSRPETAVASGTPLGGT